MCPPSPLTRARHASLICFRPRLAWLVRPLMALAGFRARRQHHRGCPRFTVHAPWGPCGFGARGAVVLLAIARWLHAGVAIRAR